MNMYLLGVATPFVVLFVIWLVLFIKGRIEDKRDPYKTEKAILKAFRRF